MFSSARYILFTASLLTSTTALIAYSTAQDALPRPTASSQSVIFQRKPPQPQPRANLAQPAVVKSNSDINKIIVVVNGIPLTKYDVDNHINLVKLKGYNKPDLIQYATRDLIDNTIKEAEIANQKIKVPEETINKAFNDLANDNHLTAQQFKTVIENSGVDFQHFVDSINTEIGWQMLVGKYIQSKERVDQASASLKASKAGPALPTSTAYRLKTISLFVPEGSKSQAYDIRVQELRRIKENFTNCASLNKLTAGYKNVIIQDMGLRYAEDLAPELRNVINATQPGTISEIMSAPNGPEALIVCSAQRITNDNVLSFAYSMENLANITQEQFIKFSDEYMKTLKENATINYIK